MTFVRMADRRPVETLVEQSLGATDGILADLVGRIRRGEPGSASEADGSGSATGALRSAAADLATAAAGWAAMAPGDTWTVTRAAPSRA